MATQGLQASNIDEELIDRGLSPDSQNRLSELWSLNPSFGGPIASDKLWFHVSHTTSVADRFLAGLFPDSDPNDLNYTPTTLEPGSQTVTEGPRRSTALRLTWQAAPRHKVTAFWDHNRLEGTNGAAAGGPVTDEAAFDTEGPNSTYQVSWTNPVSSRLLLEAAASLRYADLQFQSDPRVDTSLPTAFLLNQGVFVRGIGWFEGAGAQGSQSKTRDYRMNSYRASLSYVTGSHAFKVGMTAEQLTETLLAASESGQRFSRSPIGFDRSPRASSSSTPTAQPFGTRSRQISASTRRTNGPATG